MAGGRPAAIAARGGGRHERPPRQAVVTTLEIAMSFGGHLRALRGAAKLYRAELARQAGAPVSTLRHWENDRGFAGIPAFLRLAEALGVPAERLAEGVDDPAEGRPEPVQEK